MFFLINQTGETTGFANVDVDLYESGVRIATVQTTNDGSFVFDSFTHNVAARASYQLRVELVDALANQQPTIYQSSAVSFYLYFFYFYFKNRLK